MAATEPSKLLDPKAVTAALQREDLKVQADEAHLLWTLSFEIHARSYGVILFLPPGSEYFLALCTIPTSMISGPIEGLSVETLRTMFKVQNETTLAKLFFLELEGEIIYAAMSPCSTSGWDGPKLRKRLRACAEVVANLLAALFSPVPSQGG